MTVPDDIKLYFFHHHHYIDIPPDEAAYDATWVVPPGRLFDPEKGHALYQRHLRYMRLAEELGFDGICINEHHNTVYSMTPAVSLMGAAIATATTKPKIMVAGVPVNLTYAEPGGGGVRDARRDVGRADGVRVPARDGDGVLVERGRDQPDHRPRALPRVLEVITKAWTEEGPSRYEGDFYTYRYLNPWPKPFQKPYPKFFIVGLGEHGDACSSPWTSTWATRSCFTPIERSSRRSTRMRELAERKGRERPARRPDRRRHRLRRRHRRGGGARGAGRTSRRFFGWFHRVPPKYLLPPGYVSTEEFLRRASDPALAARHRGELGGHGGDRPDRLRLARHRRGDDRALGRGSRRRSDERRPRSTATCPSGRRSRT